jgi:hypothetical protein
MISDLIPPSRATVGRVSRNVLVLTQAAALALGLGAAAVGLLGVYEGAFPGTCGDNAGPGLAVIASWALDLPVGLAVGGIGWLVRRGSGEMRKMCIVLGLATLALPVIATLLLARRNC